MPWPSRSRSPSKVHLLKRVHTWRMPRRLPDVWHTYRVSVQQREAGREGETPTPTERETYRGGRSTESDSWGSLCSGKSALHDPVHCHGCHLYQSCPWSGRPVCVRVSEWVRKETGGERCWGAGGCGARRARLGSRCRRAVHAARAQAYCCYYRKCFTQLSLQHIPYLSPATHPISITCAGTLLLLSEFFHSTIGILSLNYPYNTSNIDYVRRQQYPCCVSSRSLLASSSRFVPSTPPPPILTLPSKNLRPTPGCGWKAWVMASCRVRHAADAQEKRKRKKETERKEHILKRKTEKIESKKEKKRKRKAKNTWGNMLKRCSRDAQEGPWGRWHRRTRMDCRRRQRGSKRVVWRPFSLPPSARKLAGV